MGRKPIGPTAMSGSERQRKYWAGQFAKQSDTEVRKELAAAQARIRELEKQLARKPATADAPSDTMPLKERIAVLEMQLMAAKAHSTKLLNDIHDMMLTGKFQPKLRASTKPKVEKPPLPPDEERERQIKGLKTRVKNLTAELNTTRAWHWHKHPDQMPFLTMSAISKCLHPDQRDTVSDADKDKALGLLNAWKADSKKARS